MIRAAIHGAFADLLGTGITGSAQESAHLGKVRVTPLGDAEIHELGPTILGDHHVARLNVPVNDARRMGVIQGISDPGRDL